MMRATLKNCLTPPPAESRWHFGCLCQPDCSGVLLCINHQKNSARYFILPWEDWHLCIFRELKNTGIFTLTDSLVMDEGEVPLRACCMNCQAPIRSWPRSQSCLPFRREKSVAMKGALFLIWSPPSPDYSVFDSDRYMDSREKMRVPLRLSRGCAWQQMQFL